MKIRPISIISLTGLILLFRLASAGDTEVRQYLPEAGTFTAEYVVIERDPEFDPHNQRVQKAIQENPDWWNGYITEHAGKNPIPWHENFGVEEDLYNHFQSPINHFREVSRRPVSITRTDNGSSTRLTLGDAGLLISYLEIDSQAPTVVTSRGTASFRSVVDLDRASLPPGKHKGVLFNTPQEQIIATRSRESILIGSLKGTSSGIIHYGYNSEAGQQRAYLLYDLN